MTREGGDEMDAEEEYVPYAPSLNEIATSPMPFGDICGNLIRHVSAAASPAKTVVWEEGRIRKYLEEVQAETELHLAEAATPDASDLVKRIAESFKDRVHRARALLGMLERNPEWEALRTKE